MPSSLNWEHAISGSRWSRWVRDWFCRPPSGTAIALFLLAAILLWRRLAGDSRAASNIGNCFCGRLPGSRGGDGALGRKILHQSLSGCHCRLVQQCGTASTTQHCCTSQQWHPNFIGDIKATNRDALRFRTLPFAFRRRGSPEYARHVHRRVESVLVGSACRRRVLLLADSIT